MRNRLQNKSGLTILELMITTVIIGILAATAVPRFQTAYEKLNFRTAMRDMNSTLRLARSMAVADKGQYGVAFNGSDMTVTLFKDLVNTDGQDLVAQDSIVRIDTLPASIEYLGTDVEGNIFLFRPNGSCRFTGGGLIQTVAHSESLIAIYLSTITPSTGRVATESHYY
ncbi:MAG: prepilin-type N-terminal cleavage/methylation domain-containing protein [candidate division Zixibacteria bacterium]